MFEKVIASAELITLPDIYIRLKKLIEEPDYTMAEVALLVGSDPGMSVRFLRAVNNPLNRRACKIETVSHAVSLLGIRQVHDIVLGASVAEAFEGIDRREMDMPLFWQRSFLCAIVAKQLAMACDLPENDRLFINGLLHDIGHLFMYIAIPTESLNAASDAKERNRPLFQSERELLGFDYAEVGAYMMRQWNLPERLHLVTRHHTEPVGADAFARETAMVHTSAALVRWQPGNGGFGQGAHWVDPTIWPLTGLTEATCLKEFQASMDQCKEAVNTIF